MTIYDNVKERADKLNKSISQIEVEAGIANGTIGGWRTSKPFAETISKVAKVFNCTIEDLITEKEEK